ncbi:hypothetical protein OIV83_001794 [Microbotryomycetes sp. JL201]|nr:hypothetical protein OIV83_001794 [Microbotryomycetes sp. JL201]
MGLFSKLKGKAEQQVQDRTQHVLGRPSATDDGNAMTSLDGGAAARPFGFVTAKGSELYMDNKPFKFVRQAISSINLNAPELLDGDVNGEFEVDHTFKSLSWPASFATSVTRTYTLRIKSKNIGRGHINGWSNEWTDWMWDEGRLKEFDLVLAKANEHKVHLIIPLVNNGSVPDTNWVGDFYDLTVMRKGLSSYEESQRVDWWTDGEMIEAFKLIIDFLANRVNTITGVKYSDDPAILAWETGNEMNYRSMRPAPASWTLTIAKHLRSRMPNHLVMDGSFARTDDIKSCYPKEVLDSPDVDIVSYHYYGDGDIKRVKKDVDLARKHNKVFVAGEFGFFSKPDDYAAFCSTLSAAGGAGALTWSLRPASDRGGFKTHGEDGGHWSYRTFQIPAPMPVTITHVIMLDIPGTSDPLHHEFDHREHSIVSYIRTWSFKINQQTVPKRWPAPSQPSPPFFCSQPPQPPCICFKSSVWASTYDVVLVRQVSEGGERVEELGSKRVSDSTKEGCLAIDVSNEWNHARQQQQQRHGLALRGVGVDGQIGPQSDVLWF